MSFFYRLRHSNKLLVLGRTCVVLGSALVISSLVGCVTDKKMADAPSDDAMLSGFIAPPVEARPRVWWHWMNGNITEDGIVKDLEWMQRVGLGGVQNFDAAMDTPIVVDDRLVYMSPKWKKAFALAVAKSDELGLEFSVASSPGWSLTGGPWVKPEDAMKKLVWTETYVTGGKLLKQRLSEPSGVVGPYQDIQGAYTHGYNAEAIPDSYYRDVSVLAYSVESTGEISEPKKILSDGLQVDPKNILDGSLSSGIDLPTGKEPGSPGIFEVEYEQAQSIQTAVVYIQNLPPSFMGGELRPTLQVLASENRWQTIAQITLGNVPTTVSFPAVSSTRFRLLLTKDQAGGLSGFSSNSGVDPSGMMALSALKPQKAMLMEFRLGTVPKLNNFELKAAFQHADDYHALKNSDGNKTVGVNPEDVIDISQYMSSDGVLEWSAPEGNWKILRLGYSLTGKTNSPATNEATGLEVDKYDRDAVERYLNTYLGMYESIVGNELIGPRGLEAILTDSSEAGPANWTPSLVKQFKALRGYDPTPWLPVLTGDIVGTREQSNGFLYDYRHTLGQLNASEHYGTIAKIAHDRELTVYGESLEGNRKISSLGDDLELRRFADIPMAAMWTYRKGGAPSSRYVADMRGAASVGHLYGKKYVAAESLTSIMSPWAHSPADLQPMIDSVFLNGINRPVIHTSAHQPVDNKFPGISLNVFGQYFTRHETWAEMAKPWIDYISRNSYLLQQGENVADVAYFYGEEPPISVLADKDGFPKDVPARYAYDFIPADAIYNELSVHNSNLVSSGGAQYKVLFLGANSQRFMTLPLLQRIAQLVEQGATLVGLPPQQSPSLKDNPKAFVESVNKLWGVEKVTSYGKGKVVAEPDIEKALVSLGVNPDFESSAGETVEFVHRLTSEGDIYYVANRGEARQIEAKFRVTGKTAEIWHADTGTVVPASYRILKDSTEVSLDMNAWESFFIVFREKTDEVYRSVDTQPFQLESLLDGQWEVSFQKQRGGPDDQIFNLLTPLSEHQDPRIRYFSGITTYRTQLQLHNNSGGLAEYQLDLGSVGDLAEVYINGVYTGTAWKPPYKVDVSDVLRPGTNAIEVRVANLWVNRLIGDRQPKAQPITYTTFKTYLPTAPLRPSGLIGPVKLLAKKGSL